MFAKIIHNRSSFFLLLFLLLVCPVFSQESGSTIQHQFEAFTKNNYQEKVFLHTDKTVYATGEVLWFKAYITDASSNNFSALSKICYVEIISEDKRPLMQGKISIDSGRGNGSFLLPSSIRSGNYSIRAYTNWMKNFDPQFYFRQNISIINPNKKPEYKKEDSTDVVYANFFPEGGNLVYGLNNNVACKITDRYGKGMQAKGFIVSGKDTVTSFATERFGMGTFSFNPVKGNMYQAIIKLNNTIFKKDLPQIYDNGWTLHVADDGNKLSVKIACNIEAEHQVFLFVQTRGSVKNAAMLFLTNGSATFTIDKSTIADGISQITVFNEKKQPVCERLYFKKPANLLQIKMDGIEKEYHTRSKVSIQVATTNTGKEEVAGHLSAAVYLADSLQPETKTNIVNYLWLSSELKGPIESPDYYFSAGTEAEKAADNLMLTQGWRRFKWEDVLANTTRSFTFLPEYEGHIITGRIASKMAGIQDTNRTVYLSVPGKSFRFSSSQSSASGLVRFNVEKFYGNNEIILQTNRADSNYRLFIDNPFSDKYDSSLIPPVNVTADLSNAILLRSIGAQSLNLYQPEKEDNFRLPVSYDTTAFYGIPSKTYYLDNYTRFPTMEEVMREYVKEVRVRKRSSNFYYEVLNEPDISFFNGEPLTLIDGIPVFNVNKIIDIDPLKVKKIDITANSFFKGDREYKGIVSYSTYNGDLNGYTLDPNSAVIEYEGLQYEREFYSPQYETPQQQVSRLPDFRNVLYWSPALQSRKGKNEVSFYTSDIPGKYTVLIQGISDGGLAGVAAAGFTVSSVDK